MGYPAVLQYPSPQKAYPHRDLGIVLLILGVVGMVGGGATAAYCGASVFGVCVDYPFVGVGAAVILAGLILLVVGLILMFESVPSPQPVIVYPQQPQLFVPAVTPQVPPDTRYCPSCGGPSSRAAAFCNRCGKPLPPPPQ